MSKLLVKAGEPLPDEVAPPHAASPIGAPLGVEIVVPGTGEVATVGQLLSFRQEEWEGIVGRKLTLYVICTLAYRDTLLAQHEPGRQSSGCWRFDPTGGWATADKLNLAP